MDIYPIQYKYCTKCHQLLSIDNFYKDKNAKDGFKYKCKACTREYVLTNTEKRKETCKSYYKRNKENGKLYHQSNKEKIAEYKKEYYNTNKEKIAEYKKEYYNTNKEKIAEYKKVRKEEINVGRRKRHKERKNNDVLYHLSKRLSSLIRISITRNGYKKTSETCKILGCSFDEFSIHIENQFLDNMSWSNRIEWHLDHIVPIAFAMSEQELIMLNHYSNFRPIWAIENIIKSDTITEETRNHPLYVKIVELRKYKPS